MKQKDLFDVTFKLQRLADDARDLSLLLFKLGSPGLAQKLAQFADSAASVASYTRVHEELPPEPAPEQIRQVLTLPSGHKLTKYTGK